MKKFGFTLAEILISMGIIGVVAAICIPTLGTSARQQANIATLKVTASDFENAFGSILVAHAAESFDDNGKTWIQQELANYMKVDGGKTKNGCEYSLSFSGSSFGQLKLDVNGNKGLPNKEGSDIFILEFDEYGQFTNLLDYTNKDDKDPD